MIVDTCLDAQKNEKDFNCYKLRTIFLSYRQLEMLSLGCGCCGRKGLM